MPEADISGDYQPRRADNERTENGGLLANMAQIPDSMLADLRALIDTFAQRGREALGVNDAAAVVWAEAAADLAVAMTIN